MPHDVAKKHITILVVLFLVLGTTTVVLISDSTTDTKRPKLNNQAVDVPKEEESDRADQQATSTDKSDASSIDTSDWKTYQNEKYGFEIKYPSRYVIDLRKEGQIRFKNPIFDLIIHDPRDPGVLRHSSSDGSKIYVNNGFYLAIYPRVRASQIESSIRADMAFCTSHYQGCKEHFIEGQNVVIYRFISLLWPYYISYFTQDNFVFVASKIEKHKEDIHIFKNILSTFNASSN